MLLNNNGYEVGYTSQIENVECDDYFRTFEDRMPQWVTSVSVNENVLNCLLSSPNPSAFTPQRAKIGKFMCSKWSKQNALDYHWVCNLTSVPILPELSLPDYPLEQHTLYQEFQVFQYRAYTCYKIVYPIIL